MSGIIENPMMIATEPRALAAKDLRGVSESLDFMIKILGKS